MDISNKRYMLIHKTAVILAIAVYLVSVFSPLKALQPGIIFVLGAGFFNLFQHKYFLGKPKLAAHIWLIPVAAGSLSYSIPIQMKPSYEPTVLWLVTMLLSGIPFFLLITGKTRHGERKKRRPRVVNARILVQCTFLMLYATVTSFAVIKGTRADLVFWGVFHVLTVAILPFLFGRVLCSWLCPNATLQDGLIKHLNYRRPIGKLPASIEAQSRTAAMNTSKEVDKAAPLMPATLLLAWFPLFFAETVFDLTKEIWYPIAFMYGLFFLSFLMPWRKLCTHFCWLSSYRGLAGHNSLWRIRYNKAKCKECKRCLAEEACPFFIDIRSQDNEMPATCSVCFSCVEACPFADVLTFRRGEEEKKRLRLLDNAA